jgi:hypothetical protein
LIATWGKQIGTEEAVATTVRTVTAAAAVTAPAQH